MKTYKIAVIPGDGTGPEVVAEGIKVMEAVGHECGFKYETVTYDFGAERYIKTKELLPNSAIDELKRFHAIYLGAIGHPDVKPVTLEEVVKVFKENNERIKDLLFKSIEKLTGKRECLCSRALKDAIIN